MGHVYTYDEIKQEFESRNYILLTDHKLKCDEKYEYVCKKHIDKGSQFIDWGHFHCTKRGCYYCGREKSESARRKDLSEYEGKTLAESKGFEYIGMSRHDKKIWVQFICPKHKQYGIQEMPYNNMKRVVIGCQHCIGRSDNEEEVLQEMYNANPHIQLLEPYQGRTKRIKMLCTLHNVVSTKTPAEAIMGKGCYYCGLEKLSEQLKMPEEIFIQRLHDKYPHISINGGYDCITSTADFHCERCGNDWIDIADYVLRRGCVRCECNTTESKLGTILQKHQIRYMPQFSFKDCKDKRALPFDFYLVDYNMLIEYDGEGHYRPVNFGGIDDETALKEMQYIQRHDEIKTNYCQQNNIPLIRIPYWQKNNLEEYLMHELKQYVLLQ